MASITFNNLKSTNKNIQKYTYVDIALDIQQEPTGIRGNWKETGTTKDIKVAFDVNAIKNSLTNLFNTVPGERFLLPEYGSDLRRYVFEPITDTTGGQIGREIFSSITRWEPRVKVTNVDIQGFRDINQYNITISIQIPFLKQPFTFKGILNREGYIFS